MPILTIGTGIQLAKRKARVVPAGGSAISFIGTGTVLDRSTANATWVIDNPTSPVLGDLLVLVIANGDATINSGETGWTQVAGSPTSPASSTQDMRCYWRYATGSEPADYTFVFSASVPGAAVILHYRDSHASNPIDAIAFNTGGFNGSFVGSSISPVDTDGQLIYVGCAAGTRTITGPGGSMTERANIVANPSVFVGTETLAASGATGTRTATSTNSNWATMMLALTGA
jgi:hypothetical protein